VAAKLTPSVDKSAVLTLHFDSAVGAGWPGDVRSSTDYPRFWESDRCDRGYDLGIRFPLL